MTSAGYDVARVREDFPILSRRVHGKTPLVYLDSAATSQKPLAVLDTMTYYYRQRNANVHRGIHALAEEATQAYEGARDKVAAFIGAPDPHEVVFTKNATEAINVVAYSLGNAAAVGGVPAGRQGGGWEDDLARFRVGPGDEIVVTEMEHHSNLVPWQMLCQRTGATLRWFGLTDEGRLDLSELDSLITERTKVLAVVHQSNILGTVNPIDLLVRRARQVGALVVVDACQSVPHMPVDVAALGADFVAFSGHKMLGPTGIGVLWGKEPHLRAMPPFLGGGEMIQVVEMSGSTYAEPPHKFEAGTPMIAEAIGLGAAVDYLTSLGMDDVHEHVSQLTGYALDRLEDLPGVQIVGPRTNVDRGGAVSFVLEGLHPHDVGQVLDERGVAVRVGQHCARPVCVRYGVMATTRASFGPYTSREDIDALADGLTYVRRFFGLDTPPVAGVALGGGA